jgi:PAS domain S-box-containing protein
LLQDFKIIECNNKALTMFSGTRESLIGKTPFDLSPENQPDGISSEKKVKELLNTVFKEGVIDFELWHKKLNGELFLAKISASSFKSNGKYYVAATLQDITWTVEEQQELQNYRIKLEQLAVGVFLSFLNITSIFELILVNWFIKSNLSFGEIIIKSDLL